MSNECSPVAALAIFGVGALLFGFYFVMLRNRREAEHLPISTCRSVPMGLVEVSGRATGGVPFPSPFGNIPSYCSRLVVEEWRTSRRTHYWHAIFDRTYSTPFEVEDGTGRVRIAPEEADLHLETDYAFDMRDGLTTTPAVSERLRALDLDEAKIRERLLAFQAAAHRGQWSDLIGESTLAMPHRDPQPRGDLTAQVFARALSGAKILQDLPRMLRTHRLVVRPGEKPLRMREENLCPGDEAYVLGTAHRDASPAAVEPSVVIGRGDLHPWFAIGEGSQRDTLLRMMRHGWVVAAAGLLLMLAALSMLGDCLVGPSG
jgi:hypothetical protein